MELKPGGLKIWHTFIILPGLVLLQVFQTLLVAVIASLFHYPFQKDLALLGLVNIISIGMVVFVCMFIFRIPWRQVFPIKKNPWLIYPVLILTVLGLDIVLSEFDNILRYFFHIPTDSTILAGIEYNPWAAAFTLVVIAPMTEEILFRGFILRGFQKQYPNIVAILVSAILFGAIHLNWQQIPGAAILGILLGWVFLRTGSILPCLLIHGLNNGLVLLNVLVDLHIPGFSGRPPITGAIFQPLWFDALGLALFTLGLMLLMRILRKTHDDLQAPPVVLGVDS